MEFNNVDRILGDYHYTGKQRTYRINNILNIDSPINCEQPSIIFNPKWYDHLFSNCDVCLAGEIINKHSFLSYSKVFLEKYIRDKFHIDMYNYRQFIIMRPGLPDIPIFYLTPCGHCHCCLQSKTNEYSFRATCETAESNEIPLFITLTYRPEYRPEDGVSVQDCQLFLKKLRYHVNEALAKIGEDPVELRYLLTSEYGKKGGLPHYHLELWNYPLSKFDNISLAYRPIYKSWKQYMLFDGKRKYHYNKKTKKRKPAMRVIGRVDIKQVTTGCTSYITKYFRKEDHNILGYPNKTFLLSSRRNGGIGAAFIKRQFDFVYANRFVNKLEISIFNDMTNKIESHTVSGYIKNLIFPTKHTVLPKKQVDYIRKFVDLWHELKALFYRRYDTPLEDMFNFKSFTKLLYHYIPRYSRLYYVTNYKHIFKFSFEECKRYFKILFNELFNTWLKIDRKALQKANDILDFRDNFNEARLGLNKEQHINMIARYDKYCRNYHNYSLKCTF